MKRIKRNKNRRENYEIKEKRSNEDVRMNSDQNNNNANINTKCLDFKQNLLNFSDNTNNNNSK